MPKKKRPSESPQEQFKRFQETAKKLDVEKNTGEVEEAFKKIATAKTSRRK